MALAHDDESGFSENDIQLARQAFFRDCPNGRCSKRKFLTFIRRACFQKTIHSNIQLIKILQNYRQSKKFFSMMFDIYDQNHDGELDFDEYIYALSAITGTNRLRTIETLFKFFDVDNQGYIKREDFNSRKRLAAKVLGQYKTGINENLSYNQAFNALDFDKDGRISKEDFIRWHLKDHFIDEETKPVKKRARLLRNLSSLVEHRGQIKTSSLQQKDKTTTTTNNNNQELSSNTNVDQYLLKVFRRARNRFHDRKMNINDNQSESGVYTASTLTTLTDDEINSNSFFDNDDFQSISSDDSDSELLCQSLEEVLMETLLELRQRKLSNQVANTIVKDNEPSIATRL